jgi:exopolysaccharide biosynthesis polyprenyl glycosylphosphotransferase
MTDSKSHLLRRLLIILDCCLSVLSFAVISHIYMAFIGTEAAVLQNMHLLIILVPSVIVSMQAFGAYDRFNSFQVSSFLFLVSKALLASLFVTLLFVFVLDLNYVSRGLIGFFYLLTFVIIVANRLFLIWWYFKKSIEKESNYLKILIIGTGERAQRLTKELKTQHEWGVTVVGYLDTDASRVGQEVNTGVRVLGTVNDISIVLRNHVVEEVILALPRSLMNDVAMIATACEEEGVQFLVMSDLYDLNASRISLTRMGTIPLLRFEPVALDTGKLVVKRMFDLVLTLLAMPLIAPLMACIALAIKLDDGGPVFFVQERVGFHKRRFSMIKFRTMCVDAEKKMKEIEHLNEAEGPIFKMKNDPRVTRVGHFLRKTSLDEIPQLLNVLRGHMSLIGPRPMSLRDVDLFDRGIQRKRFSVRPGLTCIWQISGRSDLPFEKWLELDLEYIDNWSLWLDVKILVLTIPAVMKGSGAV